VTLHRAIPTFRNETLVNHTVCWETNQYFTFGSNTVILFQNYYVQPLVLYELNTNRISWQFRKDDFYKKRYENGNSSLNKYYYVDRNKKRGKWNVYYIIIYIYIYIYIRSTLLFSGFAEDTGQWR